MGEDVKNAELEFGDRGEGLAVFQIVDVLACVKTALYHSGRGHLKKLKANCTVRRCTL